MKRFQTICDTFGTFKPFFLNYGPINKESFFKRNTVFYTFMAAFFLIFAPLFASQSLASDSVSSSGAFMLPIPIATPPGRAGIQPELSLTYNSQELNSWTGVGWSIGLGAIHRTLKDGVRYDEGEYAVNGLKLLAVTEWNDPENGYFGYAPEIQKDFTKYFKKVDQEGSVSWEVHSKDGKVFFYGSASASRQEFNAGTDIFKWCLDKVMDANGNYMTISYTKDNGQIYLDQIDYTGNENTGMGTTSRLIFHLQTRDDHNSNYAANYEVRTEKRLKTIEVQNKNVSGNYDIVRAYALEYDISDHTSRSRLKGVAQYGSDASITEGTITGVTSLTPHRFEYNAFTVDGSHFDNNADGEGKIDNLVTQDGGNWLFQTDFNGDGKTDLMKINKSGIGTSQITIELIKKDNNSNEFTVVNTQSWTLDYPFTTFKVGDFNGDGMTDLFQTVESLYKIEGWYMYASNGESLKRVYTEKKVLPDTSWGQAGNDDYVSFTLGDFNGDGKSDILLYKLSHVSDTKNYALYLSPYDSFEILDDGSVNSDNFDFELINEGDLDGGEHDNYAINVQIGDFNGDGKSDVLAIDRRYNSSSLTYSSGYKLFVSSGSSLVFKESKTVDSISQDDSAYMFYTSRKVFGDFNGDDKTDFLYHNRKPDIPLKDGYISVYHSDGEKFIFQKNIDMNLAQSKYFIGDFNGDNRDDIGAVWDGPGGNFPGYTTYLFEDDGLVAMDKVNFPTSGEVYYPGDYDGDGATDLFVTSARFPEKNWMFYISKENNTPDEKTVTSSFDLLTEHTNPLGGITSIDYRPSSDQDMTEGTMAHLHRLPFVLYLVRSVTLDDRVNNTGNDVATYTYTYNNGEYDFPTREFRGFGSITLTDPDELQTKKYFYQDEDRKGIVRKMEKEITSTNHTTSNYTWSTRSLSDDITFLYLEKEEVSIDNKTKYILFEYDENGNTTSTTTSEDAGGNSGVISLFTYENLNSDGWIWRKKSEIVKKKSDGSIGDIEKKTEFTYYAKGNLKTKKSYVDSYNSFDELFYYDTYGNLTSSKDGRGRETTFEYDSSSTYLVKKTLPAVGTDTALSVSYTYDTASGQIKTETDENNNTTTFTYDEFGREIKVDYPDGGQVRKEYMDFSVLAASSWNSTTGVSSYQETFTPSRIKTKVKNSESDTSWSKDFFDGMGRVVQSLSTHSNDKKVAIRTEYDALGREENVSGPAIVTTSEDSLVSVIHPYSKTTYDGLSRPLTKATPNPNGGDTKAEISFVYDGYVTTMTDPDWGKKQESKDYLGRIIQIDECTSGCRSSPSWITTTYEYDIVGNLINVADVKGNKISMTYDMLGQQTSINDADTGTTVFVYDNNGNLSSQKDNAGIKIYFNYDELNRLTSKSFNKENEGNILSLGESVRYTYDESINGKGVLSSTRRFTDFNTENSSYKKEFKAYDEMGRVTKVSESHFDLERTTEYEHDPGGRVTQVTYPYLPGTVDTNKIKVTYSYYPGTNLIKTVSSGETTYAAFPAYTAGGKIDKIAFGNGVETDYTYYNNDLNLKQILTKNPENTLMDLKYTYTMGGNIESRDDKGNTYLYTYDSLKRLKSVRPDYTNLSITTGTSYTYDDIGNLTSRRVDNEVYNFTYDTEKVHTVKRVSVGSTGYKYSYMYDDNGNLMSGPDLRSGKNGNREFAYNSENMPVEISSNQTDPECPLISQKKKIELFYGGETNRVVKKVWMNNAFKGRFDYYDIIFQQYTSDESGAGYATYHIFANNLRIASVKKPSDPSDVETRYFHKDHLGSTGVISNSTGESKKEIKYLPYGHQDGSSSMTDYLFTDQEFDEEIGLYNYDARMYDPMIGRFTTADSIVPDLYNSQGLNRYSYCLNNPLRYTDPTGHKWELTDRNKKVLRGAALTFAGLGLLGSTPALITGLVGGGIGAFAWHFVVGVTASLSGAGVNKILIEDLGLDPYLAGGITGGIVMFSFSKWMKFGWELTFQKTIEGMNRGILLTGLNDFHEGDYWRTDRQIEALGIRIVTGVPTLSMSAGMYVGELMLKRPWADDSTGRNSSLDQQDFSLNSAFNSDLSYFGSYEGAMRGYNSVMGGYYSTISDMRSTIDNFGSDYSWNYFGDSGSGGSGYSWNYFGDSGSGGSGLLQAPMSSETCEFSMISARIQEDGLLVAMEQTHIGMTQMNMLY